MHTLSEVAGQITDWMRARGFHDEVFGDAYLSGLGERAEASDLTSKFIRPTENAMSSCVCIDRGVRFILRLLPERKEAGSYNLGRCFLRSATDQNGSQELGEVFQLDFAFVSESASFARAKGIVVDLIECLGIGHSSTILRPIKLPFLGPAGVVEMRSDHSVSNRNPVTPVVVGCAGVIRPEVWESLGLDPDRLALYVGLNVNILGNLLQKGFPK
jgi:hypothetical protein